MDFVETAGGVLIPSAALSIGGVFICDHVRDGEVIDSWEQHNLVTNQGLNALLDAMFHGAAAAPSWFVGLFEGNYTPVASVTAATIVAQATESTAYEEGSRVEYNEAAASGQSITNAANRATFTFNATKTIYGAFLTSAQAKGATTGVLFAASRFGSPKAVVQDDQLLVTYQIAASSV